MIKENKNILVVSTMSSGKSTLINAIIGEDILLSKNEACTSTLYYIKHDYSMNGNLQIRCYCGDDLILDNNINIKNKEYIRGYMIGVNKNSYISRVELISDFKGIDNLSIIDTPGTNNSLDKTHLKKTIDALKYTSYDKIVYLLNATQLGTNDDRELLELVKKNIYIDKKDIVFVLNKIDELDIEKDESLSDIHSNCKIYLKSCGFENPKVFMTSAYLGKLINKRENKERLTKREKIKLEILSEIVDNEEFNLDNFNKNECNLKCLQSEGCKKETLNGTGIVELRNYLTMGEI